MHEWSPVQVSGSMPKRSRTTRLPSFTILARMGLSRRCLFSMHSLSATMIFGPFSSQRFPKGVAHPGVVTGRTQAIPTPLTARSMLWPPDLVAFVLREEGRSCPPVAAE